MSAEYIDDVPYIRHFVPDLSPARLRLAAALNGLVPPPAADFDYCEIGCAHGDTIAALAAAYPNARFLGVDINAAHVASAKKLARDGGLENIGILDRDFSALLGEDVGTFDYITAHGVLSWVSPEKRKDLTELARRKLKPGGLLHVSYNTMPGWASVEPLRQLLLFGGAGETSLERARRGLEFARSMERAGTGYFAKNPAASEMLDTMTKAGLPYVVHEYLHEHWTPMYFARVAWEMAASDLHFVGVLPIHLNYRDFAIPEASERALAHVSDRVTFESLKDFALNEFFRRDLYVKGQAPRTAKATNDYLEETAWSTLASPLPDDRLVRLTHRNVALDGETFDALFRALAEGATTVPALAARRELAAVGIDAVRAAIVRLIVAELVVPMQKPTTTHALTAGGDNLYTIPSTYNQSMLRRLSADSPIVMTSAAAGTAFPISALEGLAIRVLTEVAAPEREAWVHDLVSRNVLRIRVGERVIAEPSEQRAAIADAVEKLRVDRLGKLVELGVLRPRA